MKKAVFREITPLNESDCFLAFSRIKEEFVFPIHIHKEYEINFVENAAGAQRVVGDSIEEIDNLDLAIIASPTLEHAWLNGNCKSSKIKEITIQFAPDLLDNSLLKKKQFSSISDLLIKAQRGVVFSGDIIKKIKPQLEQLAEDSRGLHSVLQLFSLLYDLSLAKDIRMLSSISYENAASCSNSRRIERAYAYMQENYKKEIRLSEVAEFVGMSEAAFSRYIKKKSGKSFVSTLNDVRLSYVSHLLTHTTQSVSEICYSCGFNNLSNFNRLFLKKKNCTPREFRESFWENRVLV